MAGEADPFLRTKAEVIHDEIVTATRIGRLRSALRAIQEACVQGTVCDDVAWFGPGTTLYDFCALELEADDKVAEQ